MKDLKINKAVIAAAGWSTRFLPAVKAFAKPLIPILNKANIQYLVEELIAAGINEIAIVHRHGEKSIKKYFTPDPELEGYLKETGKESLLDSLRKIWQKAQFRFIPQPRRIPYGNASPILAAKGFINNQPFVYFYGDDILLEKEPGLYLKRIIKIFKKYQAAAVAGSCPVAKEKISSFSSVKYLSSSIPYQVEKVIEKPKPEKAFSNITLFGRFVFSPKIIEIIKNQKIVRGELWLTNGINTLAQKDIVIAEPIKEGKWLTTGDPANWLKTTLEFALANPQYQSIVKEFI